METVCVRVRFHGVEIRWLDRGHELVLVLETIADAWRWLQSRRAQWVIGSNGLWRVAKPS